MRKRLLVLYMVSLALLAVGNAYAADKANSDTGYLGNDDWAVRSDGSLECITDVYEYAYMPMEGAQSGATTDFERFRIYGLAREITQTGMSGYWEKGSVEGYSIFDATTDNATFCMDLPKDFVDGGEAADLELNFDMSRTVARTVGSLRSAIDVKIYKYGSTRTAVYSGDLSMSGTTRGFATTGIQIGDDADITASDVPLYVVIAPQDANAYSRVYGARLKYRAGIDAV